MKIYVHTKIYQWDFPGGAVVGSLPAGAGDTGSGPGPGGSHMLRSGWAPAPQLLSGPRSPQLERAHAQRRRPSAAKNK